MLYLSKGVNTLYGSGEEGGGGGSVQHFRGKPKGGLNFAEIIGMK